MIDEGLFRLMAAVERTGVWLSVLAWLSVLGGNVAMVSALRHEKRRSIWAPAIVVGAGALVANLADYVVTLYRSPDLSLEANPLWRNVIDHFGLTMAKTYGLSGKILVSVLAAQMFAFYLSNRMRLFPVRDTALPGFLLRMGDRSRRLGDRVMALFVVFAFLFAGIQMLGFYIAYLNWIGPAQYTLPVPSFPVAILIYLALLGLCFVVLTYRAYRSSESRRAMNQRGDCLAAEGS